MRPRPCIRSRGDPGAKCTALRCDLLAVGDNRMTARTTSWRPPRRRHGVHPGTEIRARFRRRHQSRFHAQCRAGKTPLFLPSLGEMLHPLWRDNFSVFHKRPFLLYRLLLLKKKKEDIKKRRKMEFVSNMKMTILLKTTTRGA